MKLPDHLFSSYKQYKEDTNRIASWLADTSRQLGLQTSEAQPPTKLQTHGQLKGKNRKTKSIDRIDRTEQNYVVRINDFIPMADHIVKKRHHIPADFIELMKRCISARTGTTEWFDKLKSSNQSKSGKDQSHKHFVDILQDTLEILLQDYQPNERGRSTKAEQRPAANAKSPNGLSNRFSALNVEDDQDAAYEVDTKPIVSPKPNLVTSANCEIVYELDHFDDNWECYFAFYCFFKDMHELRSFLARMWALYKGGEVDLSTAAMTTNTAFELVRRAEDDFNYYWPLFKAVDDYKYSSMSDQFYKYNTITPGSNTNSDKQNDIVDLDQWHNVRESLQLSFQMLSATQYWAKAQPRILVGRPRFAMHFKYDREADRTEMTPRALYEQDVALLGDFIGTVGLYALAVNTPYHDKLTIAIHELVANPGDRVEQWLTFAAQVLLDVHHVLQEQSEKPFDDLYEYATNAVATLDEHFVFVAEHGLGDDQRGCPKSAAGPIEQFRVFMKEAILEDKTHSIIQENINTEHKGSSQPPRIWNPHEHFKSHPILCGTALYTCQLQMQILGIDLFNATDLAAEAHLYNALKQHGDLPGEIQWPDMEILLRIHPKEDIFIMDELPLTLEDCVKRLVVAFGMSLQTLAGFKLLRKAEDSKYPRRQLKNVRPIAELFKEHMHEYVIDLSLHAADVVLSRSRDERENTKSSESGATTERQSHSDEPLAPSIAVSGTISDQESISRSRESRRSGNTDQSVAKKRRGRKRTKRRGVKTNASEKDSTAFNTWENSHQLSILQFLDELHRALELEILDCTFDYFGFVRRCWTLVTKLDSYIAPDMVAYLGHKCKIDQSSDRLLGPPLTPFLVMQLACNVQRVPSIKLLKCHPQTDPSGMQRAGTIMADFLRDGSGGVEAAREEQYQKRKMEGNAKRDIADSLKNVEDLFGSQSTSPDIRLTLRDPEDLREALKNKNFITVLCPKETRSRMSQDRAGKR